MDEDANPLAALVAAHCERSGDTLAAIAARGGMSRQTLSGLVSRQGPKAFPRGVTLERLAKGLDMPIETIRVAAARTALGDPVEEPQRRRVTTLLAHVEGMSDSELDVVLATAKALRRMPRPA